MLRERATRTPMKTVIETPEIASEGSRPFDSYLARPEQGASLCVLVLPEMFGVNDAMRAVADNYARRGYAALVPNLFWRSDDPRALTYDGPEHQVAWDRLKALDLDAAARDVQTAATWLRSRSFASGKIAAVGFCGGGRIAFLAAARTDIDAAASLYGLGIAQHLDEIPKVKRPLQIHYGLTDRHIPQSEIDAVAAAASDHEQIKVFLYPQAGHSFANPVRPTYDAAAARLALARIETMLAAVAAGDAKAARPAEA
jgi:carboxymethylenebutenolidase